MTISAARTHTWFRTESTSPTYRWLYQCAACGRRQLGNANYVQRPCSLELAARPQKWGPVPPPGPEFHLAPLPLCAEYKR